MYFNYWAKKNNYTTEYQDFFSVNGEGTLIA